MLKLFILKRNENRGSMFKTNKNKELQKSISRLTYAISQLKNKVESNDETNQSYNKMLIKRAHIRKRLSKAKENKILNLFNLNFTPKKEKLISDYFNS